MRGCMLIFIICMLMRGELFLQSVSLSIVLDFVAVLLFCLFYRLLIPV